MQPTLQCKFYLVVAATCIHLAGMPNSPAPGSTRATFTIPRATKAALAQIAKSENRTVSYLLRRIAVDYARRSRAAKKAA